MAEWFKDGGTGGRLKGGGLEHPQFQAKKIKNQVIKVAFPSFKISKFSGGGFPQTPLHVGASGARL